MFFLPFTFFIPLLAFVFLQLKRNSINSGQSVAIGVGSTLISFLIVFIIIAIYLLQYDTATTIKIELWSLVNFAIAFDGLAMMMIGMISAVTLLSHLFISWHMKPWFESNEKSNNQNTAKFFAFSNLLLAGTLLLVLSDNLTMLYVSWELVGLSCFSLMRLNYSEHDTANAKKSLSSTAESNTRTENLTKPNKLSVTGILIKRVGSLFLLLNLLVVYQYFDTTNIYDINHMVSHLEITQDFSLVLASMFLIIGVVIKSAQFPVHTWLINWKSAPLPVLSMIHSLAIITIGVYVIARLHTLLLLTPDILFWWLGTVGAIGILVGSICALAQSNIKRILIYTTMSQTGYMFVALALGAWQVAIYHLFVHAFISTLLFLAAAALIKSVNGEQDIYKMGGLNTHNQTVFISFIIGLGALMIFPLISFGLYAKESVMLTKYLTEYHYLFYVGNVGLFLTAMYCFKMISYVFYGDTKQTTENQQNKNITVVTLSGLGYKIPLVSLLLLSTLFVVLMSPPITEVFPNVGMLDYPVNITKAEFVAFFSVLSGLLVAWYLYVVNESVLLNKLKASNVGGAIYYWCCNDLGLNILYALIGQRVSDVVSKVKKVHRK